MTSQLLAKRLYEDREQTGDIVFIVDSERFHAHKCILAALSPKYKTQFYGSRPDNGEILVANIKAAAFKEFIKFFYGRSAKLTFENITEILNLAKQCLVTRFVDKCGVFLNESLNKNNVCWMYRLAILYELKSVRTACEANIRALAPKMFKSADFLRCEQNVLVEILKIEPMNCDEWELLKGCMSWAESACARNNLSSKVAANLRSVLGSAVGQIRFKAINLREFTKFNAVYTGFFSLEEFQEITNIIANLTDFKSKTFNQRSRKRPADSSDSDSDTVSPSEESDYSS